jgi:hypothetical protein
MTIELHEVQAAIARCMHRPDQSQYLRDQFELRYSSVDEKIYLYLLTPWKIVNNTPPRYFLKEYPLQGPQEVHEEIFSGIIEMAWDKKIPKLIRPLNWHELDLGMRVAYYKWHGRLPAGMVGVVSRFVIKTKRIITEKEMERWRVPAGDYRIRVGVEIRWADGYNDTETTLGELAMLEEPSTLKPRAIKVFTGHQYAESDVVKVGKSKHYVVKSLKWIDFQKQSKNPTPCYVCYPVEDPKRVVEIAESQITARVGVNYPLGFLQS